MHYLLNFWFRIGTNHSRSVSIELCVSVLFSNLWLISVFFICSHLSLNDFSQLSVTDISEMTPSACTHKRNIFLFFGTTKQIASHSIVGPIDYTQWIRRKAKSVRIFSIFLLFFLLSDNNDGVLSSVYRTIHFVCVFAEHTDREYSGWTTAINITFIRQWWWLRTTVSTTTTTTTTTIKTTTVVCWPSVKKFESFSLV